MLKENDAKYGDEVKLKYGEEAQARAKLHAQWLEMSWGHYHKEGHAGLAMMYTQDERFKAFYDRGESGKAEFLKEAILIYTGKASE